MLRQAVFSQAQYSATPFFSVLSEMSEQDLGQDLFVFRSVQWHHCQCIDKFSMENAFKMGSESPHSESVCCSFGIIGIFRNNSFFVVLAVIRHSSHSSWEMRCEMNTVGNNLKKWICV